MMMLATIGSPDPEIVREFGDRRIRELEQVASQHGTPLVSQYRLAHLKGQAKIH